MSNSSKPILAIKQAQIEAWSHQNSRHSNKPAKASVEVRNETEKRVAELTEPEIKPFAGREAEQATSNWEVRYKTITSSRLSHTIFTILRKKTTKTQTTFSLKLANQKILNGIVEFTILLLAALLVHQPQQLISNTLHGSSSKSSAKESASSMKR